MTHYHQSLRIQEIIKGIWDFFDNKITAEQLDKIASNKNEQLPLIKECERCSELLMQYETKYCEDCDREIRRSER